MSEITSSLPLPAHRRSSSPIKMHTSAVPLREQLPTNRNMKAPTAAPLLKAKIDPIKTEPRKTLVERSGNPRTIATKSNPPLGHTKSKSTLIVPTSRAAAAQKAKEGLVSRPNSVNGKRPTSATGTRPGSASSVRPNSANGNRSEEAVTGVRKVRRAAWDTKGRLEDMEEAYRDLKGQIQENKHTSSVEKDTISAELVEERSRLAALMLETQSIKSQFELASEQIGSLQGEIHIAKMEREQLVHRHRMELEDRDATARRHELQVASLVAERDRELEGVRRESEHLKQHLDRQLQDKEEEISRSRQKTEDLASELNRERGTIAHLKDQLALASNNALSLVADIDALKHKTQNMRDNYELLQENYNQRVSEIALAEQANKVLLAKLTHEETQRRALHNQIQELKGNIRVFCRIRPALVGEPTDLGAIRFTGQDDELEVIGTSADMSLSGKEDKFYNFHFDKVRSTTRR